VGADEFALAKRSALPDPLRVLVGKYPRIGWDAHANFTMLTRFWLDRHLGFRRMQEMLAGETEAFLARERQPQAYGRGLLRVAGMFINELHGHHTIEDHHYFPLLKTLDPRLAAGFDLLDADHDALDGAMHALAEAANAVLGAVHEGKPAELAAGALGTELARFARLLDRHLVDEEELVVPVILDHPEAGLG
jgi:iron-sulfur cluster repair protein YtfE (RIC family)